MSDIINRDAKAVWHPYSSLTVQEPMYSVKSAKGVRIELEDGRQLIDGMASWWSVIHGYSHPKLIEAAKAQIDKVSHVMFGGLTHEPAVSLCESLVQMTPKGLDKVFLSDSGSVACEVAIKMAFQYWISLGQKNKNKLVTIKGGYHGDTFATMSVCDPITGMHHMFDEVLAKHFFIDRPSKVFGQMCEPSDMAPLKECLEINHQQIAALILEPIVQGTGGMYCYSADYLKKAKALCEQYNVLLIADEIATGFGRTGKLFACEHAQISPDILCLGKNLTGGFMSLAATLCSEKIAKGICEGEAGVFMHGPTFMGNPLACAVANASIKLLNTDQWQADVKRIEQGLLKGLEPAKKLPQVREVRVLGGIGVIELVEPADKNIIQPALVDAGIWLRPFGKLVYTLPPYVISDEDLETLTREMVKVVASLP